MNRRDFNFNIGLGIIGVSTLTSSCQPNSASPSVPMDNENYAVSEELSKQMYNKALEITKSKVRGGDSEPFFKKPFVDAAFSDNIFL
ncbi:MAG: hypothetical protein AB8G22_27845 [Saprospiraceae bacterium]